MKAAHPSIITIVLIKRHYEQNGMSWTLLNPGTSDSYQLHACCDVINIRDWNEFVRLFAVLKISYWCLSYICHVYIMSYIFYFVFRCRCNDVHSDSCLMFLERFSYHKLFFSVTVIIDLYLFRYLGSFTVMYI